MLSRGIDLLKQWSGVLALFLVLSGGAAYAANTISSGDIVNNQVYSADVRDDSLSGGGLTAADLRTNSVGRDEIVDGAVRGAEVSDRSLRRIDVSAGQFGSAPATATYTSHDPPDFELSNAFTQVIATGDHTDGESGGPLIHLSAPGRVLASAILQFGNNNSDFFKPVECFFGISPDGDPTPTGFGATFQAGLDPDSRQPLSMLAGTNVPAGDYYLNVGCAGDPDRDIFFMRGTLIAWALPAE